MADTKRDYTSVEHKHAVSNLNAASSHSNGDASLYKRHCSNPTSSSPSASTSSSHSSADARQRSSASIVRCESGLGEQIADHYNKTPNLPSSQRRLSRIYYLRSFNNWIKAIVIENTILYLQSNLNDASQIRVIDIGCGKGGDLHKYMINNANYLIFTDIAKESLENCKKRYQDLKDQQMRRGRSLFKANFIHADSTREVLRDLLPERHMRFNLALMQFAYHYSFESLEQAEQLLKNVSDLLQPGGCFVGTTVDAYEVIARARRTKSNVLKNELFRIELPEEVLDPDWKPPLFGCRYHFQLDDCVDCPEFLVYFPVVERLAARVGLKLNYVENFAEYFEQNLNEASVRTLLRMKALQSFPLDNEDNESDTIEREFAHAKLHLQKNPDILNRRQKIGTLSKSEWEIASLYCVFSFYKE